MKKGKYLVAAAAAMFASSQANAALVTGQISIGGYAAPVGSPGFSGATGYDAVANGTAGLSPGLVGGLTSYGQGTGSFAGLNCNANGTCGTIADILSFAGFSPIANFLTLNVNGIAFDLNSIGNITRTPDGTGGRLAFEGSGIIRFNGYDPTPGVFSFTAQGTQITSFSASAISAAVPEPATWAMMLLGFGAIGFAMRRRRQPALLQLA